MRIGSLFSGAGMLDLAALQLFPDSELAWHCEFADAPAKVLAHHWPDVPNYRDVTEIDWAAMPPIDVLTGGFPCQDVSSAGRRAGLSEGTRSGLWSHMATAIDVLRPRYVLIENVRGLLSADAVRNMESDPDGMGDGGSRPVLRALGAVLGDLADIGYDARWAGLRASDVGACHHRYRVFILACPANADHSAGNRERTRAKSGQGDPHTTDADRNSIWQQSVSECGSCDAAVDRRNRADIADTPRSGRTGVDDGAGRAAARGGRERQLAGSTGGASVPVVLPTPTARDHKGANQRGDDTCLTGALLPTPRATDGTKGGPNQHGSSGDLMLPSAVMAMLPTPDASAGTGGAQHPDVREGHSRQLIDYALLADSPRWGEYEPAIRRQEQLTRPAPPPTEPNSKGKPRLSAEFASWMMMLPENWVTDPAIGLSRNDQLKIIGNGVVTPCAVAAFRYLLEIGEVAA